VRTRWSLGMATRRDINGFVISYPFPLKKFIIIPMPDPTGIKLLSHPHRVMGIC